MVRDRQQPGRSRSLSFERARIAPDLQKDLVGQLLGDGVPPHEPQYEPEHPALVTPIQRPQSGLVPGGNAPDKLVIVRGCVHGTAGTTDVIQRGLSQRHPERFIYEEFSMAAGRPGTHRTLRQGMGPGQLR